VTIDEFQKADLRVANILEAERVEGSEKLVRLQIELGEEKRQLVAGIGRVYTPEDLVGKQIVMVANLDPRKLMGIESNGMLLAASDEDGNPILLTLDKHVYSGAKIK
jgi:methionyl-tRNA synthetase